MRKSCHFGATILLLQNLTSVSRQHNSAYPEAFNNYHLSASQQQTSFFICINRQCINMQCVYCYTDLQEKQSTSKGCRLLLIEIQVVTRKSIHGGALFVCSTALKRTSSTKGFSGIMESFTDLAKNGSYDYPPGYLPQSPLCPQVPIAQEKLEPQNKIRYAKHWRYSVTLNDEDEATIEQTMGKKATEELYKIAKRKIQEAERAEDEYFKAIFLEMKEAQLVARDEKIKRVDELMRLERERQEQEKRKEEREQEHEERERKQEERERKKEEREEILYEQRIMSTDTTKMDEIETEYYSLLKTSIIKKRRVTGFQL
ncbi:hypothetical protein POM88_008973 [Heracleum sosnowskyi]|uniref:Uncharacterized protein n=1 Tax=Heracleum sosnowskyi TaxID=360622 RepID=A0AAD8J782_9APIA|nr:hypothetical protein POM88_008973 [Heracleum sosnowskyi]